MSQVYGPAVAGTAANVSAPGANTAAVVTFTGVQNQKSVATYVIWSYTADPTGVGNFKIEDGSGNTILTFDVTKSGPGAMYLPDVEGSYGNDMICTLAAGGGGNTGKLNIYRRVKLR